jgi:chemotaxis signal transduction protein
MTQYLLFDAAGMNLATPADFVKSVHESLTVQPVASTKPWFLGLAVTGGKLMPVSDIGIFAGRQSCTGRTLELAPSVGMAGLRVDEVFGFTDSYPEEFDSRKNVTEDSGDVKLTFTEHAIMDNGRVFRVLDIAALVQSKDFINIRDFEGE